MLSRVHATTINLALLLFMSSPTSLFAVTMMDQYGESVFESAPKRIAALSWELAEDLVELGVTPLAMPEIEGYSEWVVRPAISDTTEDIGSRAEPNLEKLTALQPDVIVITPTLLDLRERLSDIAPVLVFDTYRKDHNNMDAADKTFLQLGRLVGREEIAQQRLVEREQLFQNLTSKLRTKFGEQLPEVTTVRFASTSSVWVYGDNAMPTYVLERLGLKNGFSLPVTQWGVTQIRIKKLNAIKEGYLLYFEPFHQQQKLERSLLWKAMPFVRHGKVNAIRSTWTYGGAMSLGYLAQALTDSLLDIAP
ncbi:ABC transporter substrate-binding protein [Marinomonas mediterranea]|jgi:ABC-type Fe3+-hydroxamate transport system, periplasmic component|uniref:ABC-type transporter, periplasmic subunit n=1 Tax=Marinomonas mediterranea (strain ATCC 700492 / JCM 21426 / NBRC 103028 / MMB-1) TaxID=717774 RepID=F2JZB5_MARM1|nr:iron-siderophore ABC transporter substrate-binding protein [Marinomonas mediterranea]ADZ93200.1 ABC-type transporter, periplasmic subunit [Marinomonas mediterranea MMB-1]WCN15155.1 ABC transporter substrate-binding protein [Marinomonas mediterranea]WCN19199.1 ABC transporter substrate-binding protein [Marinomonas mediterranea MMB-1]